MTPREAVDLAVANGASYNDIVWHLNNALAEICVNEETGGVGVCLCRCLEHIGDRINRELHNTNGPIVWVDYLLVTDTRAGAQALTQIINRLNDKPRTEMAFYRESKTGMKCHRFPVTLAIRMTRNFISRIK